MSGTMESYIVLGPSFINEYFNAKIVFRREGFLTLGRFLDRATRGGLAQLAWLAFAVMLTKYR